MSPSLIAGALWAIAATIVALLPMRLQFPPGIVLLISAPFLVLWIGATHGWVWAGLGLAAFLSMFRRPLWYFARKWTRRI
ncbi:DUF2484 family protein [uncultured Aliiroseovarius sp.]|uniref:DUF2484 family protein n=1 Tax=uncultured Aliiroseovarius sp. TaxID=1658783 RepID=UPI002626F66A|nr:DUF2484 family protein [uncultured Aliiroseovarius sp.]